MLIALSIDGLYDELEYIRYGSKWESVKSNFLKIISDKNLYVMIPSTLQAYNALTLTDVYRLCDEYKLPCYTSMVINPRYASIDVLPPLVRTVAAGKDVEIRIRCTLQPHYERSSCGLRQNPCPPRNDVRPNAAA